MPPTDGRNISGEFIPAAHGFDGMIRTCLPNQYQEQFDKRYFEAIDELGGNFALNLDTNSGKPLGAGGFFRVYMMLCTGRVIDLFA